MTKFKKTLFFLLLRFMFLISLGTASNVSILLNIRYIENNKPCFLDMKVMLLWNGVDAVNNLSCRLITD